MVRSHTLTRFVAGLFVLQAIALLHLDCGGSDVIDTVDASFDATLVSDGNATIDSDEADAEPDVADAELPDADASIDVPVDVPVDVPIDVPIDVPVDVAIDSPIDSGLLPNARLGAAKSFAILAGASITSTGATFINGDIGIAPNTISSITATPAMVQSNGSIHANDSAAQNARLAVRAATDALLIEALSCTPASTDVTLGGSTLPAGVYCFTSSADLTGDLVLDANNDPNAEWIFKTVTTLFTATGASGSPAATVSVINGGSACNVYWVVGTAATLNTYTEFMGNIIANTAITVNTGTTVVPGRLLTPPATVIPAATGAVTMEFNTVSIAGCP